MRPEQSNHEFDKQISLAEEHGFGRGMHQLAASIHDVIAGRDWDAKQILEFIGRCEDASRVFRYSDLGSPGIHFVIGYALSDSQEYAPRSE